MHCHEPVNTCLINIPYGSVDWGGCFLPLVLVHLATLLDQAGIKFIVNDLQLSVFERKINFRRPGVHRQIAQKILGNKQLKNFLFLSMDKGLPFAVNLAKEIKRLNPESNIIFGGVQATLTARQLLLSFKFIDIIVLGEGESTVIELIRALDGDKSLESVSGLALRKGGRPFFTPPRAFVADIDALPMPNFSLIPALASYQPDRAGRGHSSHLDVGRGCGFKCAYCSSSKFWGGLVRQKTPSRIYREMKHLYQKYHITDFIFNHDQFMADRKRIESFCELFSKKRLPVTWRCYARVDLLDKKLIERLAAAGCTGIFVGLESASPRLLKQINKRLDLKRAQKTIDMVLKAGMLCLASFIMGFPNETKAEADQTLSLSLQLAAQGCQVEISLLEPYWDTALWQSEKNKLVLCRQYLKTHYAYLTAREAKLIAQEKEIFSCFYNYRTRDLSLEEYYEMKLYFFPLIYMFPQTLLSLSQTLEKAPLWLCFAWRSWLARKGCKGVFLRGGVKKQSVLFLDFAIALVRHNKPSKIEAFLIAYEGDNNGA
ncbi:hypothetical protein COT42_07815 [Candidatus Saganbacteria bacterium CG08_land_8_20_14_0_20_45_16]|uniref:Uncharacterized protein n=1 Tax=Candidatus Saganbacteria bacterium CG08_land_8_20_14_0_20_45_16 TaxID=2014293 RepID=A0A2H0XUA8_UNCSA|nr:MAG: hypothetical protein COT42_07815 [Candidatus Saganbacteria bacterium CG08_land_8_20_14_0_20_45_16]